MGKRRHLSRRLALQVLYAWDYLPEEPNEVVDRLVETGEISRKNWTAFSRELVTGTIAQTEALDAAIAPVLANWRIERLSVVDRSLLRLALFEMRAFPDIPVRVTLNEYIELAKEFGTEDSSSFVNGILDRLAQPFLEKDFQQPAETK